MRNFGVIALAGGLLAVSGLIGCATTESSQKVADADQAESHCQVDDSTGSRLHPVTTCDDESNAGASAAVRGIQGTANIGPLGH
jgi:hypothetical protein